MADDKTPTGKNKKKRGEGPPPPLAKINIDIEKGVVMVGRSPLKPVDARVYAEKILKVAEAIEKIQAPAVQAPTSQAPTAPAPTRV